MFAHASAATVAASNTAAPPVSVRRNWRRGVCALRAQAVVPEKADARRLPGTRVIFAAFATVPVPARGKPVLPGSGNGAYALAAMPGRLGEAMVYAREQYPPAREDTMAKNHRFGASPA